LRGIAPIFSGGRVPRYIVRINVEGSEPLYAVFSTIVMGFVSKFYRSLEDLWRDYPEHDGQGPLDTFNARIIVDEKGRRVLEIRHNVLRIDDWKS
jgi:hypothetical protein